MLLPFDVAGLRLLRQQVQPFMAGIEINAGGRVHPLPAHGLEEFERLGDGIDDLLIGVAQRRVTQEAQIPVLRVVQIREPAVDQRTHEIQGERGALVAAQQQFRIRFALRRAESRPVDIVAAVARQGDAVAGLGIGRARLGILAGKAADTNNRLLQALQQHQAHLQQDLQASGDVVGFAVLEALRAISALQQELLAALRLRQLRAQCLDFPGNHQRRQTAQRGDDALQRRAVGVSRLLGCKTGVPTGGVPVRQGGAFRHAMDASVVGRLKSKCGA